MMISNSPKKGFTLAELLAAITILAVLALITLTTVSSFLKNGKEDLYQKQLNNIKLAAKNYVSDHKEDVGECMTLTLEDLQKANLIDENIKDPRTGKVLDNKKIKVKITKEDKVYKYEVGDKENMLSCYRKYSLSEKVALFNNSNYYVISDNNYYVTLMKDKPLTVDEVNKYGNKAYIHGLGEGASVEYYTSDSCKNENWNPILSGCTNDYNKSLIKGIVDNWANDQFQNNELAEDDKGYKSRLITLQEIQSFGYDLSGPFGVSLVSEEVGGVYVGDVYYYKKSSDAPLWLYEHPYWTMTPVENVPYAVMVVGGFYNQYVGVDVVYNEYSNVRPVINIKKSALEGGSNNE